jgi:hypothetical protein
VAKPLDMQIVRRLLDEFGEIDAIGRPTLGGWKVRFEDGCVILPWKGSATNRVAEEFAIKLQQETGCALQIANTGGCSKPANSPQSEKPGFQLCLRNSSRKNNRHDSSLLYNVSVLPK